VAGKFKLLYFRFPVDTALRAKWISAMGMSPDWDPTADQRICSAHFLPEHYDGTTGTQRKLQVTAVPTKFDPVSDKGKRGRPKGSKNRLVKVAAIMDLDSAAGGRRTSGRATKPTLKTIETSKTAYDSEDDANLPMKKRRIKEEVSDDDKRPPVPEVNDDEVDHLLEYVVEPAEDDDQDGAAADDEEDDMSDLKVILGEVKENAGDSEADKESRLRELLNMAREKLKEARTRFGGQRKKIVLLERTLKRKKVVNKQLRSKVLNLQEFIKKNRPRLYEPPIRRYWRDRPRLVRGTQTRQVEFWAVAEGSSNPVFSDDNVADYDEADFRRKQEDDSRKFGAGKKRRKKMASMAAAGLESETENEDSRSPIKKRIKKERKVDKDVVTAIIIPTSYTKELPKPIPKMMPGIKPAPSAVLTASTAAQTTSTTTIQQQEQEESQTTTTTIILPDHHHQVMMTEDEEGGTSTTTTVVIEETPEGTIIQQQPTTTTTQDMKPIDVSAALAQMKPVHVIGGQMQQPRHIQIQSDGQSITGIPVKILQDATTVDGQKISIIKIQQDGSNVHQPQQVYVTTDGVTFASANRGGDSMVVSEVIMTTDNEMPSADELLKSISQ
jgi:hypothetical protein